LIKRDIRIATAGNCSNRSVTEMILVKIFGGMSEAIGEINLKNLKNF